MTRRRFPAVFVMVAALAGAAGWAAAQTPVPPAVVQAVDLTADQVKAIDDYVAALLPKLADEDKEAIKNARNRLLEPLKTDRPSVRFRQVYSDALTAKRGAPTLGELAASPRDEVAFNAVRVAGELATPAAVEIVQKALADQRPGVRIMAAAAMGRTFSAVNPALGGPAMQGLIGPLGRMVASEQQPFALDAAVRGLTTAMTVTRQGFEGVRADAAETLFREAAARARQVKDAKSPLLPALLRAGQAARDALAAVNDPQLRLNDRGTKQALTLSDALIELVAGRVKDFPQVSPGDADADAQLKRDARATAAEIVQVAESAAVVGLRTMQEPIDPKNIADDFKKATPDGDKAFFNKVLEIRSGLKKVI